MCVPMTNLKQNGIVLVMVEVVKVYGRGLAHLNYSPSLLDILSFLLYV